MVQLYILIFIPQESHIWSAVQTWNEQNMYIYYYMFKKVEPSDASLVWTFNVIECDKTSSINSRFAGDIKSIKSIIYDTLISLHDMNNGTFNNRHFLQLHFRNLH